MGGAPDPGVRSTPEDPWAPVRAALRLVVPALVMGYVAGRMWLARDAVAGVLPGDAMAIAGSAGRKGCRSGAAAPYAVLVSTPTGGADIPDDSVLDSLRGAVDPLEARHESDPARPADLRTQITRFFLTGVLSAVVDYGLLQLLMLFGLGYGPAKALSFVAGTLTAYSLNRRWTFQAEPSRARFVATMGLYALMFGVQWGLFMLLVPLFHDLGWSTFWATTVGYVIAQGVATVTNFIVQRTVIFRVR